MKHQIVLIVALMSVGIFTGCKKQESAIMHTPQEKAAQLYMTESFIRFAGNFVQDFYQVAAYLQVPAVRQNRTGFLSALHQSGSDEQALQQNFAAYGLSFDEWVAKKNKLDNDWLQLFLQLPELHRYSEQEVITLVMEGIRLGIESEDNRWQEIKNRQLQRISTGSTGSLSTRASQTKSLVLDVTEVWGCLKDAVGVGSASILGIAGIQKLAGQGIQAIVLAGSKFLAKYAGWIGLAVMVFDFSSCIYGEMND